MLNFTTDLFPIIEKLTIYQDLEKTSDSNTDYLITLTSGQYDYIIWSLILINKFIREYKKAGLELHEIIKGLADVTSTDKFYISHNTGELKKLPQSVLNLEFKFEQAIYEINFEQKKNIYKSNLISFDGLLLIIWLICCTFICYVNIVFIKNEYSLNKRDKKIPNSDILFDIREEGGTNLFID